jgi:hypothetical protein
VLNNHWSKKAKAEISVRKTAVPALYQTFLILLWHSKTGKKSFFTEGVYKGLFMSEISIFHHHFQSKQGVIARRHDEAIPKAFAFA